MTVAGHPTPRRDTLTAADRAIATIGLPPECPVTLGT
jgi:hypothetical protein